MDVIATAATPVEYKLRFVVNDAELSALHALAFGEPLGDDEVPWRQRLDQHALSWVGAFNQQGALVGFVQVIWDGGAHGFLLDTVVDPAHQRGGIGRNLVTHAVTAAREAGCEWLHVDFEPHLQRFYVDACGFQPTEAGTIRLV